MNKLLGKSETKNSVIEQPRDMDPIRLQQSARKNKYVKGKLSYARSGG